MTNAKPNTTGLSRKEARKLALAKQSAQRTPAPSPMPRKTQVAQDSVAVSMSRVDTLFQEIEQAAQKKQTNLAPHIAAVREDLENPASLAKPKVADLVELVTLIKRVGDNDTIVTTVPLNLIKGCPNNHRRFAVDFETFVSLVPALPDNWESLEAQEYIDQCWAKPLSDLYSQGKLDDFTLDLASRQIGSLFEQCQNINVNGLLSEPLGYIEFNGLSGAPENIIIVHGERRIRSYYLMARDHVDVKFAKTAIDRTQSPEVAFAREGIRGTENQFQEALTLSENLMAFYRLSTAYRELIGDAEFNAMSDRKLVEKLGVHSPKAKGSTGARYVKIARHPRVEVLLDLCTRYKFGLIGLVSVARRSEELAAALNQELGPEHIFAAVMAEESLAIPESDIPENSRQNIKRLARVLTGEVSAMAYTNGTDLVRPQLAQEAQQTSTSDSSPHAAPSELIEGPTQAPTDLPQSQAHQPERNNPSDMTPFRTKELTKELAAFGITINKGARHEEAHKLLYGLLVAATVAVDGGKLESSHSAKLQSLNTSRTRGTEVNEFRSGVSELLHALQPKLSALVTDNHGVSQLLSQLGSEEADIGIVQSAIRRKEDEL